MKNVINRFSLALGLAMTLAPGLGQVYAAGPMSITYGWQFDAQANPAAPEVSMGGSGTPLATLAPGQYAAGWMDQNPVFGSGQGVWDLGRSGQLTLNNAAGLAGDASQARVLTISVKQYQDGGIYDQLATVSVPGASLVSSTGSYTTAASLGGWLTHVSQWNVPVGAAANAVVIGGAFNGSLLDQVTLQTSLAVVSTPSLSILSLGSQVQLSWPSTSATNWVLEATTDLNNPLGWAPVGAQVQVTSGTASVTMDAVGTARFYRLKQP